MTDFLIILGLVTLVAWGYAAVSVFAYLVVFRRAWSSNRLTFSMLWPFTVPAAVVLRIRYRLQRRPLPRARTVRR